MIQTKIPILTEKAIQTINEIVARGNSAEVKPRKDDVIVLEVKRQLKIAVSASEQK